MKQKEKETRYSPSCTNDRFLPFHPYLAKAGNKPPMAERQKEQGPETQGNGRMACTDLGGWARRYD